ncbi:hypothetical protein [Cardiobacterium valvarum]|uniref:Uncharacterized protein n=1 Tax=Cardiobacterium valvarum F0432 TaxID=797473 RepID=G9ZEV8_9GAMM|nr:hypothetical protein [Cardiobacterium valvarum]EHM54277.1 hypothetical protein HMPREF9080_01297 [Cardiobacterium valvarum F0432]
MMNLSFDVALRLKYATKFAKRRRYWAVKRRRYWVRQAALLLAVKRRQYWVRQAA